MSLAENWQPYVEQDNDIKFSLKFAVALYSQEAIANWSWKILIIYIIFVLKILPLLFISCIASREFFSYSIIRISNTLKLIWKLINPFVRRAIWWKLFVLVNYIRCLFPNYFLSKSYQLFKSTFDRLQKSWSFSEWKLDMKFKM